MAHSNNLNGEPVSVVVVTPTNHDNGESADTNCTMTQRPDQLLFLDPQLNAESLCLSPANGTGYNRERRGSKSCLRVISNYDESGGTPASSASAGSSGGGSLTPTRRRSVHFDASPAATMEVPSSDAEKAQRGCGALIGPAPFLGGKEVYVAPPPDEDEVNEDDHDEENQRLALAKTIARRQSGGPGGGGARPPTRLLSPPPPPIEDDINESSAETEDTSANMELSGT